jgi:predicted RNase H-like HicB family nuclease
MLTKRLTAVIIKEEKWYVARCLELGVVSQGKTVEEAQANLREAVELYIESFGHEEIPAEMGEVMLYPMEVAVNA